MANYTDPSTGLPMVSEGGEVYLRDANGFVKVPEALAGEYVAAQGYVPATAEEVAERKRIKEQEGFIGGTKAAAKAAGTHAMDAATAILRVPLQAGAAALGNDKAVQEIENLSGHKFLENLAGITAELTGQGNAETAAREWREATRAQYKAHEGVTTAAGIAGDIVGGLGLSAGAARAGTALEGALASRFGQGIAKTAGAATEFGLQGAAAGAGQASEQAYINDDPLTSQKLLAGIGLGAALGVGGGAAVKGLGLAGSAVASKADDQLAKVFGRAQKAAPKAGDEALEQVAAKALGPDTPPAPGLGTKLRDFLEDAQAAVTGADKGAIKKYGAMRWDDEAMRGREMAFRRDEILEGAKGEVTERMQRMAKNAGTVMEEVRDSAIKREHVERLLGDASKAGAQKSAAMRELWQVQDDLAKLAAAGDQFGNRKVIQGLQKIAEKAGAAVENGSGADAFIGLDQIKRALQTDRVRLGRAAQQGGAFSRGQAEQLGQALEGMQERVRQGLMDENVWGKAGTAQREINAAWEQWFQHKSMFEQRFLQRTGENFQGRAIYEVDPAKVSSFLDKLGRKESALVDKHFRGYLDATERLTKAIGESHDIGAKAAQVSDVAAATKAIRETMTKADKTVSVANQIQEILEADGAGGALGALIGGVAGGAPGAAAGAMISAVTNPGRMLKAAWGLQNVVGKVDLAINGQLDSFFARAKQKTAGALEASRKAGNLASRVALPAGVAIERFNASGETRRMAYEKRREQVASLIANPAKLAAAIQRQIEPVSLAAPKLGQQMALDMAKALRAVQDAAPQERQPALLTPQRDKRFVSDQDIQRFGEAWEGVVSPLSLLEDLRKGDLSYAKRDAVKMAYPELFRDMQLAALDRLTKVDYSLPLQARTQLDLLLELGGAGEPSIRPDFLARQNERAKMRAAQEQTNSPPAGRAPNIAKGAATLSESITVTT